MPPKKKAARHHLAKKHSSGDSKLRDSLRTFEHHGRIQAILGLVPETAGATIQQLGEFSRTHLADGAERNAADLLRAAEHYCFGALGTRESGISVSEELRTAIDLEYSHLRERASMHQQKLAPALLPIYQNMIVQAESALRSGSYRAAALEFARGAEALTHVEGGLELPQPRPRPHLRGAK